MMRINETEAKAIGALCISVQNVGARGLAMFPGITRKRALELERLFVELTRDEINYVRSFLDGAPK